MLSARIIIASIWIFIFFLIAKTSFSQEKSPSSSQPEQVVQAPATGSPNTGAQTPVITITVEGRQDSLIGIADSANQGTTGTTQIQDRPILRSGEILETVPGVIITQHAGGGKANQYFLRGFNLDHGTDFAVFLDGMPLNLPSHAHGEGYSDSQI